MKASTGCGSGTRGSAGGVAAARQPRPVASVNGIALHSPDSRPGADELRERAWSELLRQEAVRQGVIAWRPHPQAPALSAPQRQAIEAMLDRAIRVAPPDEHECRSHYEAHKEQFVRGRLVHVRHILFAVTPGVNVHALSVRAEQALIELSRKNATPEHFAQLARELSDCPSAAKGGDLGWFGPDECAEELANELFHQKNPMHGMGLHPRLVHSRDGFHIVEVLGRKQGRPSSFVDARESIEAQLWQQSRSRALQRYLQILAGQALIEGVALQGADSTPVQ
jgi:peptidyl-prolyl cis-trans isomerase C